MTKTLTITAIITATILVVGSFYIGSNVLAPVEATSDMDKWVKKTQKCQAKLDKCDDKVGIKFDQCVDKANKCFDKANATEMALLQCFNVGNTSNDFEVRGQSSSSGITAPPVRGDNCAQAIADLQNSGLEIISTVESSGGGILYTLSSNP